jgi:hypothetical protein
MQGSSKGNGAKAHQKRAILGVVVISQKQIRLSRDISPPYSYFGNKQIHINSFEKYTASPRLIPVVNHF